MNDPQDAPRAALSPVQRLEASRARLRGALQAARRDAQDEPGDEADDDGSPLDALLRSGRRVWARHPLRGVLRAARQALGPTVFAELKPFMREHPWRLVAIAAAAGAAVVWLRPWRLLSKAALGSVLLSVLLPRRAIWQELMASGLIERLASGELFARWFEAAAPRDTQAETPTNTTTATPEPPTAAEAGVLHPAAPPADAARAA